VSGSALSVVIPALNEEPCIGDAVRSVRDVAEVIVVDGGSADATVDAAERAGARVIHSPRGRGVQLDRGARAAAGDWLVFLHADTRLEPGWDRALSSLEGDVLGGAFRLAVRSPRRAYRVIEAGVALRCRLFRLPFGDQAIFVRREVYGMIGGFPPFPLMEDLVFSQRLARAGRMAFPPLRAFTSARRWEEGGVVATTVRNLGLQALYACGWPPERLARFYGEHA
jgi:rSAM/selenodomain-associated transferase 2